MSDISKLMVDMQSEFPELVVRDKAGSRLMRVINILLRVLTLNQMKSFMQDFTTTVGYTIYVPTNWHTWSETARVILMRHERVHLRQRRRYGALGFTLLYLFVFFPVGLAYFRALFEKEAYEEQLRAIVDLTPGMHPEVLMDSALRNRIVNHFTSASYAWMWPFKSSVEAWYDDTVQKILREQ